MSNGWGRQERYGWPSAKPMWAISGLVVAAVSTVLTLTYQYERQWSFVERFFLRTYIQTGFAETLREQGYYVILTVVDQRGTRRLPLADEIVPVTLASGAAGMALTQKATNYGARKLEWYEGPYNNAYLHGMIRHWVYRDQTLWDFVKTGCYGGLGVLTLCLLAGLPRDRLRARLRRYGRRLRGPELTPASQFNQRNQSDGIGFVAEEPRALTARILKREPGLLHIPRRLESHHFLMIGDTGMGKSTLIRQLLLQVQQRGEAAIVYDPALEYTPEFYQPERGDYILNPFDARMPYWNPGEEVRHEGEALTVAASLYPDRPHKDLFFTRAPREVFAHLLTLHPTPEELARWMCHDEEIDRRVKGSEVASMIAHAAPAQREGVLSELKAVGKIFRLLPTVAEAKECWNTIEWSKRRTGWLFLTSTPETRESLLPLTSLWLDLLVLRLMSQRTAVPRPVWFVLDELSTLQRLPQLHTAITEIRKSGNPLVLGFQGRSQLEERYGRAAEAMLSQPATKIFLRTSEPEAAEWISRAIGEVEIERVRESRTRGQFPNERRSEADALDRQVERLVMASEIMGLPPMHGFLKSGNLVVPLSFPYVELPKRQPAFVEREIRKGQLPPAPPEARSPGSPPDEAHEHSLKPDTRTDIRASQSQDESANEQRPFFE